jgi:hypothetical protein
MNRRAMFYDYHAFFCTALIKEWEDPDAIESILLSERQVNLFLRFINDSFSHDGDQRKEVLNCFLIRS